MKEKSETRSAFVALIGNSNVGKSTLLNTIVGSKVSIVTHKVQTTRTRIRGIYTKNETQLVFVDTPGIFIPKRSLERYIVRNAWKAFSGADIFCFVVDPRYEITESMENILKKVYDNVILVINKIDLIEKFRLLEVARKLNDIKRFKETFMISALKNRGVDDLKNFLLSTAEPGPWYFDEEDETDMPIKFNLSEMLREKLFIRMHEELPYSLTVETENVETLQDRIKVSQIIHVISDSHKKMVIGAKGETIKTIRQQAEREMEEFFGKRVSLLVFVRVSKNWQEKPDILNTINYS